MATPPKPQQASNPAPKPAVQAQPTGKQVKPKATVKEAKPKMEFTLMFDKENYLWAGAGLALIVIGFLLMSGGKSANPNEFHYDQIFSFRRITLAPLVIMLGYAVEIYAIMKRPKEPVQ